MRSTIDFGIDLGTTNSAVAVLHGTTTEILKNNLDTDITPSAVYINKRGALITGMRAKEQTKHDGSEEDAHLEFKRRMGTGYEYVFPSSGRKMKPEELSAEILKSLRADVSQKLGEEMRAAVITVPAAFELHQCEATKKAAELAGLQFSALLQEPVAAALAYGYQIENSKGYWLVYDFGGGTFDAALIRAEGGNITVSNHGGDNFLGGSDIDWAIVEQILVPEVVKQFGWKDFNRANLGWRNEFAKLKYCAEQAKIELSRTDAVYLMDCRLKGPDGQIRELEYQLLTKDVIPVAERIIMRSVDITKRVLREKNLSATAIAKVILVGGPTLAPYFRQIVGGSLGIELDHSVDPLTVVARGAAVFAGTQRLEGSNAPQPKRGQFAVDLKYKPVGTEVDPMVGGRVSSPDKTQVSSLSIEVVNRRSKWTTGKLKLQADGAFVATLLADKGVQNIFGIELTDAKGTRLEVVPPEFAYTVGAVVDEQPIINSIGVELADRTVEFYFKKGEGLPAKGKKDFRTAFEVKRGQTATVLEIPVVEGESDRADRNVKIGSLAITGGNIKRDLPAGSSVEVTLSIDQSRLVRVKAYVPLLDEEIETRIDLKHREPLVSDLETDREEQGRRLAGLQAKAKEAKDNIALTLIRKLETSALIESLRSNLANAKADGIAALKLERDLMEFKSRLDEIEDAVEWPALTAETKRWLDDIEKLLSQFGSPEDKTKAQGFRRQIGEVISLKKTQRLRSKLKEVRAFYYQLLLEQPDFWIGYFNNLAKQTSQMRDRPVADRLIRQGRECVTANNIQGLKNAVGGLQDLLPREVAESLRKASSGIVI